MSDGSALQTTGGEARRFAYYPSLVVNFKIRFDEALTTSAASYDNPSKIQPPLADPQPAFEKLVVKDNLSQVMGLIPKSGSVELPGYRQAGKFNLTFEYKDFPLDPRTIRAMAVEIHLGAVSDLDFADGMVPPRDRVGSGLRSSILKTRTEGGKTREDTLLMIGTVDSINSSHGTSGSLVSIEGRDLRGLLLDAPLTGGVLKKLALDKPVNEVIEAIIYEHPLLAKELTFGTFKVVVDKSEWPDGVLPVVDPSVVARHLKGADGGKSNIATKGNPDSGNFWDIITQFCFLVGAIPWFKGRELRINPARNLYAQIRQGQTPTGGTPFAGKKKRSVTVASSSGKKTEELTLRRLVYGVDVLDFKLERKLAGKKVPRIICVSTDTSRGRGAKASTIEVSFPDKPKATSVSTDGEASQVEELRVPVPGIKDQTRLKNIAEGIYNEIGRGEMGGSVSTKNLSSFGGGNQDPDLLFVRPGDAIEITMSATAALGARPPIVNELTNHNATSQQEEEDAIATRLGDRNLARVLVATARNTVKELQRIFRVKDVKFDWSANGVSISLDFHNFVEVRYDSGYTPGKLED